MIEIENISVLRNNKYILENVSWSVNKGEHWCVLGLNGSGKTTLLNVINGYIYPIEGKVKILGKEFGKTNLQELRKDIGLVSSSIKNEFQPNDSVLAVVLSGKFASLGLFEAVEMKDVENARAFMNLLNCQDLEDEEYRVLSQGEQQRVLIARALMADPKILVLDEPCNGLDIIAREELLKFIDMVANQENGPTLIYVTHHVEEVLPCFTHTIFLKNGTVHTKGRATELLTEKNLSTFFERNISVHREQNRTWVALK